MFNIHMYDITPNAITVTQNLNKTRTTLDNRMEVYINPSDKCMIRDVVQP